MKDKMNTASTDITSKLSTISSNFTNKLQGLISTVQSKMSAVYNAMNGQNWASIGSNIVSGMVNGMNSGWSWLQQQATSIAQNTLNAVKKVLKIKSPSKVFEDEVGVMIDRGLALGIEDEANVPIKAMSDIANSLTDTAIGTLQGPSIASGSILPTQIASSIAKSDAGTETEAISLNDLISMVRDIRNDQQDLLETLIQVVQNKNFSLTPNAATGRVISQAIKQYQGVTG